MMRPLFAAAAAVLFGAGVPAAQAQCGCARPTASITTPSASPGVKTAVPVQSLKFAIPTTVHHVTPSAPAAGCAACLTAAPTAAPVSTAVPAAISTPAAASCPHCAPSASLTPDDKPKGDEKPATKADKEITLTGTMACAKCGLKEEGVKKCTNAIQVKEGDKTVTYYLDDKGNGETYHEGLCGGGKKEGAKVTGTVAEKDGKKWVKVTKVEEQKEKK